MDHSFSHVPPPNIERSVFNRNRGLKTTFDSGYLVPIFWDEIMPADTMSMNATFFARLSTFIFPIMDNLFLETFWFFVPYRILWEHWEAFIAGNDDPDDTPTEYILPTVGGDPFAVDTGSLFDYFGLPLGEYDAGMDTNVEPVAFAFRAYNMIFNEWFRPEYIQEKATINKDDGPDTYTDYILLRRAKRHDYFTSALPWPQKGDAIELPLGGTIPVYGNGKALGFTDGSGNFAGLRFDASAIARANTGAYNKTLPDATNTANIYTSINVGVTTEAAKSGLIGDLDSATAVTINALRQAFAYQELIEIDARGGSRYTESILAHFRVKPPDFRMNRPEYLGGSSQRINVSAVPQTSESTANHKQAGLAAYTQVSDQCRWNRSFVEHGIVIGLANVRADINYQNNLHRMWSRRTRFDHYFPALAHLGEQTIKKQEIFFTQSALGSINANNTVFGYQERFAEYRYGVSVVTGKFRSAASGSLDSWHLALDFGLVAPQLDDVFIQDQPPLDRVVAVTSEPEIIFDSHFEVRHARPMPVYSVPARLGKF